MNMSIRSYLSDTFKRQKGNMEKKYQTKLFKFFFSTIPTKGKFTPLKCHEILIDKIFIDYQNKSAENIPPNSDESFISL